MLPSSTDIHEWYPCGCAPVSAPVRILSGHFTTRDGGIVPIPAAGILNNGWGATGTTSLAAPALKALPESLQIRWFSLVENKFYSGQFELDAAQLDGVSGTGYESPLNGETRLFDRIIVGMSPGGGVAVWLKGEQITREVAFFQAGETNEDWSAFSNASPRPRSEYVEAQLQEVLEIGQLPVARQDAQAGPARWSDLFRRTYRWEPRFLSRGRIRQLILWCWNGEVFSGGLEVSRELPLPQQIDVYWANPDGVSYGASVVLDFDETAAAFQRLGSGGPLRLDLETDTLSVELTVFLTSATEACRLRKASVRAFQM